MKCTLLSGLTTTPLAMPLRRHSLKGVRLSSAGEQKISCRKIEEEKKYGSCELWRETESDDHKSGDAGMSLQWAEENRTAGQKIMKSYVSDEKFKIHN